MSNLPGFLVELGLNLIIIAVVVVLAVLLAWILRLLIRRVVSRVVRGAKSKAEVVDTRSMEHSPLAQMRIVQRTRTLGSILQNIVNVIISVIAVLVMVYVISPNILGSFALLSAAVGAGLGFGAQNIVKDVLNGIFIVAEDQVGIGDVVDLGLATGIVEFVSVRVVHVRDVNGTLWYVRNGEITRIGNLSQGWSRVIIDLAVPLDSDIKQVETAMLDAATGLQEDPKWRTRVLEKPEIWGLESVSGDGLVIRLVMKTRANSKDDVARELRMRLKDAIDALGLTLPRLNSINLAGLEGAHRIRGANPPRTRPTPVPSMGTRPSWRLRRRTATEENGADAEGRSTETGSSDGER